MDPDDPVYLTHFPGRPVVPGSLIINAFLKIIRPAFPHGSRIRLKHFGFLEFAEPGTLSYEVEINGRECSCILMQHDRTIAKGAVCVE